MPHPPPPSDLAFRLHAPPSTAVRAERARLIRDEFDLDLGPLDRLGHDPNLVSFGWWHGADLVAHVGLARETLWLEGEPTRAFWLQSITVRPEWRGRGLFRDLMERALAHADAPRPDTLADRVLLATETPDLYRPFGFRPVVETAFLGPLSPAGATPNHRRLSLADDADLALLRDLFARRTPVSRLCSTIADPAPFFLKALESPEIALLHLPDLDAVVAIDEDDPDVLTLLDVVAPAIPPLAAIAAAAASRAGRARVLVTPDRLAWTPTATEIEDAGTMVRGPWPDGLPAILSPMRV